MPSPKHLPVPASARRSVRNWRDRRRRIAFYRTFLERGDLCFDVGANRGDRVELFLAVPARVIAVEPQTSCHAVLEERFGDDPRFTLVRAAVGAERGEAELMAANDYETSVLATLSSDWASRVQASGRFAHMRWERRERVAMTTLDALVEEHGEPAFCKIDVEGYEPEVLAGLSSPLRGLSLEFTPERLEATDACVMRLGELGNYAFNYSLNESLVLASERWMSAAELRDALNAFGGDSVTFGDVYARLVRG